MAKTFELRILTAEGTVLDTPATYCRLQTSEGSFGILANHAPMFCACSEGTLTYRTEDGSEKQMRHSAGVANVRDNTVTLLTDHAEKQE